MSTSTSTRESQQQSDRIRGLMGREYIRRRVELNAREVRRETEAEIRAAIRGGAR